MLLVVVPFATAECSTMDSTTATPTGQTFTDAQSDCATRTTLPNGFFEIDSGSHSRSVHDDATGVTVRDDSTYLFFASNSTARNGTRSSSEASIDQRSESVQGPAAAGAPSATLSFYEVRTHSTRNETSTGDHHDLCPIITISGRVSQGAGQCVSLQGVTDERVLRLLP